MSDYKKWQKGNLKLEGKNWLIIQIKKYYVLAFKSRHCHVYHKFFSYALTVFIIACIVGGVLAVHFYLFPN
jgi:hypothetical protein